MGCFPEVMVAQVFDVAHVHGADAVHLSEVADRCRDIVVRIGSERTGAQAQGIGGAVMQLHHLVEIFLAVGNPRQSEDRPGRIIRMAGHAYAHFLTYRNHGIQEILEVLPQPIRSHSFILFQGCLQQGQPLRFPAGQGKAFAARRCSADDLQRAHLAQVFLVKIQAVASVFRNHPGQVRTQPVENGHEVVNDYLHAVLCQHPDRGNVVGDILITPAQAGLDILMNIHRLDDFDLESRLVHFLLQGSELLLRPVHAGGLVQQAHQAGHAGNLFDVLQRNRVRLASIPAKCHFHVSDTPFLVFIRILTAENTVRRTIDTRIAVMLVSNPPLCARKPTRAGIRIPPAAPKASRVPVASG